VGKYALQDKAPPSYIACMYDCMTYIVNIPITNIYSRNLDLAGHKLLLLELRLLFQIFKPDCRTIESCFIRDDSGGQYPGKSVT
jgi:hypothetical protein